jgi:hypothetical protein
MSLSYVRRIALRVAALAFVMCALLVPAPPDAHASIETFTVDWRLCYGPLTPASTTCPGTSATDVAPSSSVSQTNVVEHPHGTRRTGCGQGRRIDGDFLCGRDLLVTYTPADWTFTPGPVGAAVGDFTMRTDVFCDGMLNVIAGSGSDPIGGTGAEGPTQIPLWPNPAVWRPYPLVHQAAAPSWFAPFKPTPGTFSALSAERADLYTIWYPPFLHTPPFHLNVVTEVSPYVAGMRVTSTYFGDPDADLLRHCDQTATASVITGTQWTAPAAPGLYPRWSLLRSHADYTDGAAHGVLDVSCAVVGAPAIVDADSDCLDDADLRDVAGAADSDGDQLVDGVEAAASTDPSNPDSDGDGASDLAEMFTFTNPNNPDTDGDGSLDRQDTGADEFPGTPAINDTLADDNCPAVYNPDPDGGDLAPGTVETAIQPNFDYSPLWNGTASDRTNPVQDPYGDACDVDDDNDGLADVAEALGCFGFAPTNPLDPDSDDDLVEDWAECYFTGGDPANALVKPPLQTADDLGPNTTGAPPGSDMDERFFRADSISVGAPFTLNMNPDGDANVGGPADNDSDGDTLLDGQEAKRYASAVSNADTDGDGCSDGREAASVNGDRSVNVIDLQQVALHTGSYSVGGGTFDQTVKTYDFDRNGQINVIDLARVAANSGLCPSQGAIPIILLAQ